MFFSGLWFWGVCCFRDAFLGVPLLRCAFGWVWVVGVFALITFAGLFRVLVQDGRFWFGDGFWFG